LDGAPGVQQVSLIQNGHEAGHSGDGHQDYRLLLEDGVPPEEVLQTLVHDPALVVERFERAQTSLDEIFIRVVGRSVAEEGRQDAESGGMTK
jgi:hypothetical protein